MAKGYRATPETTFHSFSSAVSWALSPLLSHRWPSPKSPNATVVYPLQTHPSRIDTPCLESRSSKPHRHIASEATEEQVQSSFPFSTISWASSQPMKSPTYLTSVLHKPADWFQRLAQNISGTRLSANGSCGLLKHQPLFSLGINFNHQKALKWFLATKIGPLPRVSRKPGTERNRAVCHVAYCSSGIC